MKNSTKKIIIDFIKKLFKYNEPTLPILRPDFQQPFQEKGNEIKTLLVDFETPSHMANDEKRINYEICLSVAKTLFDANAINYKKEKCQTFRFNHFGIKEDMFKITATFKYLQK